MTDTRLFFVAGGGMLAGGLLAALILGEGLVIKSPLVAIVIAGAIAGGGAVLVNKAF